MKNFQPIVIIGILLLFSSCRSSKDLIFLKDAGNKEVIKGLPSEYKLKSGDILYVSVKSINPEVNSLFNPESGMEYSSATGPSGGRSSGSDYYGYTKYTSPSGAYLYGFELDLDGKIKLPMLGDVKLSDMTIKQAESEIQKRSDEFIKDAVVKVKLLNFKFTVMGEVRNPGTYYNYNNSLTVLEAIAQSNGNTDFASIKTVMVVRPFSEGNRSFLLDLSNKNVYSSEAFYLQPNDYVIVQPDKYKNFQLNSQAYSLVLSSLSVLIAVLGFVIPKL